LHPAEMRHKVLRHHLEQIELRCYLEQRAGRFERLVYASYIARDYACPDPARQVASSFHSFPESLERNQFKLADLIARAIDSGAQSRARDLKPGAGFVVAGFPKARELFGTNP
jgi:hypothetical protein